MLWNGISSEDPISGVIWGSSFEPPRGKFHISHLEPKAALSIVRHGPMPFAGSPSRVGRLPTYSAGIASLR